jgi:hypothetical protein
VASDFVLHVTYVFELNVINLCIKKFTANMIPVVAMRADMGNIHISFTCTNIRNTDTKRDMMPKMILLALKCEVSCVG